MKAFSIPAISNEQLAALRHIHPVKGCGAGWLTIEWPHPRNRSFLWDPVFSAARDDLEEITKIRTLHTWGYYGFFKPSIAEVLAQIPAELLDQVAAFETAGPDTAEQLNIDIDALNAGFHVATTTLFRVRKEVA